MPYGKKLHAAARWQIGVSIMKVTWLTQAGYLFESGKMRILIDPYLSDSLGEKNPDKKRRIPADKAALSIRPDVILITHAHEDHLNLETLLPVLDEYDNITILCSESSFSAIKALGKYEGKHNIVMLAAHSVWSEGGITFYAVRAEHSDRSAVGFIIDDGNKTYYHSGDTLYNYDVLDDVLDLVEDGVDFAFLPINGKGNNMNAKDAADFAYELGAGAAIPMHYGLFDEINPESFDFEDAIILEPYKETELS
jgi:L-ascorbate metabolism protein UlaG (beta-lactamase superfamily)